MQAAGSYCSLQLLEFTIVDKKFASAWAGEKQSIPNPAYHSFMETQFYSFSLAAFPAVMHIAQKALFFHSLKANLKRNLC
jgi:hypothetical protein